MKIRRNRGALPGRAADQPVTGAVLALLVSDVQRGDMRNAAALRDGAYPARRRIEMSVHDVGREACEGQSRERSVQKSGRAARYYDEANAPSCVCVRDRIVRRCDLAPESTGAVRCSIVDEDRDVVPGE